MHYGKKLTYDRDGVGFVNDILDDAHRRLEAGLISDRTVNMLTFSVGIFIGRMLLLHGLSEKGYVWGKCEGQFCIGKPVGGEDQIVAFPLGKAYKHIKNGSEDSILFFYYMVLASAN